MLHPDCIMLRITALCQHYRRRLHGSNNITVEVNKWLNTVERNILFFIGHKIIVAIGNFDRILVRNQRVLRLTHEL